MLIIRPNFSAIRGWSNSCWRKKERKKKDMNEYIKQFINGYEDIGNKKEVYIVFVIFVFAYGDLCTLLDSI